MKTRTITIIKRILATIFSLIALLAIVTYSYTQQEKFGRTPTGERLERVKKSPHYRDGKFHNLHNTPALTEGYSYSGVMYEFLAGKKERLSPKDEIPSMKTDLKALAPDKDVLVWFGHSSYFIQLNGKKILVDPVFSKAATPAPFGTNAFRGTNQYSAEDMPEIDYLFISHDHWDHLDYATVMKLRTRIKKIICGLGTGEHFEYWGFDKERIIEKDWFEKMELDAGFTAHTVPARHFSGRGFSANKSLWTSFVLQTPTFKIFIGGDSGYDTHFAEAGHTFGEFDLVILENGQYDKAWKYIHMMPEEVLQAAKDLHAKRLFPVHSGKFPLGNHPWDEPLIRISALNKTLGVPMITPMIGEPVNLRDSTQQFREWWVGVK